ncbi:hypothetical protein VKT23_009153 [Stygiomarasmius scandens]|uniref:F-box domain-containing protein n=1 Tax=Marasmiellus scandens TaxID=2682957 RepID=A0ABR1JEJ1_9AGAR
MLTPTRRQPARKARNTSNANLPVKSPKDPAIHESSEHESDSTTGDRDSDGDYAGERTDKAAAVTSYRMPIQTARRAVGLGPNFKYRSQGRLQKRPRHTHSAFSQNYQAGDIVASESSPRPISVEEAERIAWLAKYRGVLTRWTGERPHKQTQSRLFSLPAEIVDRILGDHALNERDHLALSGTCTAVRMGYSDVVWKPMLNLHTPFSHNQFTYKLLGDPCNLQAARTIHPDPSPLTPRHKLWSSALGNIRAYQSSSSSTNPATVKPGIDFDAPCYKPKHKRCKCLKLMGPSHAKVISNVNLMKTTWGHIFYHYQSLSERVSHTSFESVERINTRGETVNMYNLAAVDAAILRQTNGVYRAMKIRDEDLQRGKRKGAPKDREW